MVTPDKDEEIAFIRKVPRKARIVMEHELDGIYLARDDFKPSPKVKSFTELVKDLERVVKERPCQ